MGINFPTREHLVAPWLRQGESAMIYSPAGVGKSMFILSLALAVAGGGKFLGWATPRPFKVLFVDGEMPIDDIQARTKLLAPHLMGIDQEQAHKNLTILSRQHQSPESQFPDLAYRDGRRMLYRYAKGYDLVILDNLSTLATIPDENATSSFNGVVRLLMRLKQSRTACILVHHTGKSEQSYRGSSILATTFEVMLCLERLTGRRAMNGTAFKVRWDKHRGQRNESIRSWDVQLDGGQWEHEVSPSEEIDLMLEELDTGQYIIGKELAAALGWDSSKVTRLKQKAIALGKTTEKQWSDCLVRARDARNPFVTSDDPAPEESTSDF